jgi:hypothetical protein
MKKEITIKWLDNGNIEDVVVKIGDYDEYDDDIFFYFQSEEEMKDYEKEGIHDFIIIETT